MIWETVLASLGGSIALITVVGFLGRSIIAHVLSKDIELFKGTLKREQDDILERAKHELKLNAIEHEIRFSKLHEMQATVIAEMYKKIAISIRKTRSFVSPVEWNGEEAKIDKYRIAMKEVIEAFTFLDENRVWLDEEACTKVSTLIDRLREPSIDFHTYLEMEQYDSSIAKEKMKVWRKAWKDVEELVPETRSALENKFRSILGVLNRSTTNGC